MKKKWVALLLAALLLAGGFAGALAEADALPERTTLVDAANGNFEADMLDMLSQYTYRDILELEVHAGEETGFSAAVVDALARLRTVALNISYKAGNEGKTLRLMPGDALLLRELDGSLSFESAAEQLSADYWDEIEDIQEMLIAGETPDLPAVGTIDPRIPRFMQSTIHNRTGEYTVLGNAEALHAGTLSVDLFPPVRLWMDEDGEIWSLDHRRLAAFKLAGLKEIPFRWAMDVEFANDYWKMTTEDNGESMVLDLEREGVENPVVHRDGTITGLTGELAESWAASLAAAPQAAGNLSDDAAFDRLIDEIRQQVLSALDQRTLFLNASRMMVSGHALDCYSLLMEYGLLETIYPPVGNIVNDADYTAHLEKALDYMDKLCADRGEDLSNELALLAFLQPEIDRRAQRSGYEEALHGVLDEQEMGMELGDVRDRLEGISQLAHDMEQVSSRYVQGAVRRSEYFDDALILLNMKCLTDDSLQEQAEFWNADAWWAAEDMADAA